MFPFLSVEEDKDMDDLVMLKRKLLFWQDLRDLQDEYWEKHGFFEFLFGRINHATEQGWLGEIWELPEEPQPQPAAEEDAMQLA